MYIIIIGLDANSHCSFDNYPECEARRISRLYAEETSVLSHHVVSKCVNRDLSF